MLIRTFVNIDFRMTSRYDAPNPQTEFEPGSRGRVLRNLLGISLVRDISEAESQALQLAQERAIELYSAEHRFTAVDICELHRLWLHPIYPWAGEFRSVDLSKGDFRFANAAQIPRLMREFEREALARSTPCRTQEGAELARALAVVHAELILIHPFREGNGRLSRLLAMLMGLQAGLPPLDFSPMLGRGRRVYFGGIRAAMRRDYEILSSLFEKIIDRTLKRAASSSR
jgi:cell filamentation protein